MAPKLQLCACSFQDSLGQKNWALEQIRKFPDTIKYMWTQKFSHLQKIFAEKKISAYVWTWPNTESYEVSSLKRDNDNP